jgi:hypothetical protein
MRKIILHYHLFKNAGTSLDAAFKENFFLKAGKWVTNEFPSAAEANRKGVKEWIEENPDAICFSSHTAILPPPVLKDVKVFPVIFVRHPIDRIASAYRFEHTQDNEGFGAVLARNTSFSGYVETRLSIPYDRQCRNFHTSRLSSMFHDSTNTELHRAKDAVEELPFVGLVERFSQSLKRLEQLLRNEGFDQIELKPVAKNVSLKKKMTLKEKLEAIEEQLGPDVFKKLIDANRDDIELFEYVSALYD